MESKARLLAVHKKAKNMCELGLDYEPIPLITDEEWAALNEKE